VKAKPNLTTAESDDHDDAAATKQPSSGTAMCFRSKTSNILSKWSTALRDEERKLTAQPFIFDINALEKWVDGKLLGGMPISSCDKLTPCLPQVGAVDAPILPC
jgi:hypothetical protein